MANRAGQRFGDYRLIRFLGQGTFGDVYVGEHIYDKTCAAVKVLKTQLTSDKLKDFINEVRTFRLKHPNIVQLLDIGIGDGDIPFLVIDYAPMALYVIGILKAHAYHSIASSLMFSKSPLPYNTPMTTG